MLKTSYCMLHFNPPPPPPPHFCMHAHCRCVHISPASHGTLVLRQGRQWRPLLGTSRNGNPRTSRRGRGTPLHLTQVTTSSLLTPSTSDRYKLDIANIHLLSKCCYATGIHISYTHSACLEIKVHSSCTLHSRGHSKA